MIMTRVNKILNKYLGMRRYIQIIVMLVIGVVAENAIAAVDPNPAVDGITQADKLYSEKKYDESVTVYEQVMQLNGQSPELLYNLGNAYFKSGQMAKAVLCYERALKLDPGNKTIENNLQYVATRVDDANKAELKGMNLLVSPNTPTFWGAMYANVTRQTSSNYWALFAAFSFVLFVGALALYIFTRNVNPRKVGFFGSLMFVGFTVIFLVFSFAAAKEFYGKEEGIITAYKVELLTEPGQGGKPSTTPLTCGTKLSVLSVETDAKGNPEWYKVRLNSDFLGWVKASDFELI